MFRNDFREIYDLLRYCAHGPLAAPGLDGDLTAGMFTARSPAGAVYVALPGGGLNFALGRYLDSCHMYDEAVPPVLYLDCDPPQRAPRGPVDMPDDTPLSTAPTTLARRQGAEWFVLSIDAWRAIAAGVPIFPRSASPRGRPVTWTARGTIPEDCILRRETGEPGAQHAPHGVSVPRGIPHIWRLACPAGP